MGPYTMRKLTSQTSKTATRSWYFLPLSALTRQIRTAGIKTKAFRFIVWDKSVPSSETSNFRLPFMTSGTSLLTVWEKLGECEVWSLRAVKVLGLHLKELFSPGCKFDISRPSRMNFVSKIEVNFFSPFCL